MIDPDLCHHGVGAAEYYPELLGKYVKVGKR